MLPTGGDERTCSVYPLSVSHHLNTVIDTVPDGQRGSVMLRSPFIDLDAFAGQDQFDFFLQPGDSVAHHSENG